MLNIKLLWYKNIGDTAVILAIYGIFLYILNLYTDEEPAAPSRGWGVSVIQHMLYDCVCAAIMYMTQRYLFSEQHFI